MKKLFCIGAALVGILITHSLTAQSVSTSPSTPSSANGSRYTTPSSNFQSPNTNVTQPSNIQDPYSSARGYRSTSINIAQDASGQNRASSTPASTTTATPAAQSNSSNWGQSCSVGHQPNDRSAYSGYNYTGYGQNYGQSAVQGDNCAAPCDQPSGECWCQYVHYEPCYYTTERCVEEQVPCVKQCCRYVPKYYEVQRCRYVPQYYCETLCRYEPEYYCVPDCKCCKKVICEQHCQYVPKYYWKKSCCNPCGK